MSVRRSWVLYRSLSAAGASVPIVVIRPPAPRWTSVRTLSTSRVIWHFLNDQNGGFLMAEPMPVVPMIMVVSCRTFSSTLVSVSFSLAISFISSVRLFMSLSLPLDRSLALSLSDSVIFVPPAVDYPGGRPDVIRSTGQSTTSQGLFPLFGFSNLAFDLLLSVLLNFLFYSALRDELLRWSVRVKFSSSPLKRDGRASPLFPIALPLRFDFSVSLVVRLPSLSSVSSCFSFPLNGCFSLSVPYSRSLSFSSKFPLPLFLAVAFHLPLLCYCPFHFPLSEHVAVVSLQSPFVAPEFLRDLTEWFYIHL